MIGGPTGGIALSSLVEPWYPGRSHFGGSLALLRNIDQKRFDGNTTDYPSDWLVPSDNFKALSRQTIRALMTLTVTENALGWVIIPPFGYRL